MNSLEGVLFEAIIFIEKFDELKASEEAHKIMILEPETTKKWIQKIGEFLCDPEIQNRTNSLSQKGLIETDQNRTNSEHFGQFSEHFCSCWHNGIYGLEDTINVEHENEINMVQNEKFLKMVYAEFLKFAEMLKGIL